MVTIGEVIALGLLSVLCVIEIIVECFTEKGRLKTANDDNIKTDEVYVLTTSVISDFDDGSGLGPRVFTKYFLATEKDADNYKELFSGVLIKKHEFNDNCFFGHFNEPYIEEIEPLTNFLRKKNKKTMKKELLFKFILQMNINEMFQDSVKILEDESDVMENDDLK